MPLLSVNGAQVDFSEAGQGPGVILIHSSVSGKGQWRKLMEALSPRYHVAAYNLFGCGDTTPWPGLAPQTLADQAALTAAVARYLGGRVHLIGHSFGASVAMKAALALDSLVSSTMLLEPNPFFLLRDLGRAEAFAESCALRDDVKHHGGAGKWEVVAERFADYWNAPGSWAAMPPERRAAFLKMLPSNYHEWDAVMAETTPIRAWAPLAPRTTVLTARDTVRPIREIVELMAAHWPGLHAETIPMGGHMAPLTRPDLVNPLVLEHLARHSA